MGVNLDDVLGKKKDNILVDKGKKQMNSLLIVIAIIVVVIVIVAINIIKSNATKAAKQKVLSINQEVNAISLQLKAYYDKQHSSEASERQGYEAYIGKPQESESPDKIIKIKYDGKEIEYRHGYYFVSQSEMNNSKLLGGVTPPIKATSSKGYAVNYEDGNVVYLSGISYGGVTAYEKDDINSLANNKKPGKRIYINKADDMKQMQDPKNLNARFYLNANIDMKDFQGWVPFGTDTDMFTGSFDGKGYKISNLKISRGSIPNAGLFGFCDESANISNLVMENCEVNGGEYTGLVAAVFKGTIRNSKINGRVFTDGQDNCGGVFGSFYGRADMVQCDVNVVGNEKVGGFAGTILGGKTTNVFVNKGVVVSGKREVGGLVGNVYGSNTATIDQCYSKATIYARKGCAGGFAGYVESRSSDRNTLLTISHSYSNAEIAECPEDGGGFFGELSANSTTQVELKYNYANTQVTESCKLNRGGFVGVSNERPTISSSYNFWMKDSGATLAGVGNSNGDATKDSLAGDLDTVNHNPDQFTDWTRDGVWNVQKYPVIRAEAGLNWNY